MFQQQGPSQARAPQVRARVRAGLVVAVAATLLGTGLSPSAAAQDAAPAPGTTVAEITGRVTRAYLEVGDEATGEHGGHGGVEAVEDGERPGLLTWVSLPDGSDVKVPTDDLAGVPGGATVRVRLGAERARGTGDARSDENTGRDVLAATVLSAPAAAPVPAPPAPGVAGTVAPHQVTTVMVAPAGQVRDSATSEQFAASVRNATSTYWSTQTNGQLSFDVVRQVDWISTAAPCSDYMRMFDEVSAAVGFTSGAGKHLLLYVSTDDGAPCGAGLGTIGSGITSGGLAYVSGLSPSLSAHELGHNVGLEHSNGLLCNGVSDGTPGTGGCAVHNYRDYYDVMGISWNHLGSLNSLQSARLGALPAGSVVEPATPSFVTLEPISARAGTAPRVVRLVDGTTEYSVEYRSATGQDSWLPGNYRGLQAGVLVRRTNPTGRPGQSLLLDATPTSSPANTGDWSQALPVGGVFTTPSGRFSVRLDAAPAATAALSVGVDGVWPVTTPPPLPPAVPGAPGTVTATPGSASVAVTWSAADAGSSPVTLYRATATPGGSACETSGTGTGCTVTGLTNGEAYTVTVAATNAVGTGPGAASGTVVPRGVPSAPGSVAATRGSGSVAVTWSPADANGSPVSLYRVTTSPGGKTCVTNGSGTGCRVAGLTSGQAYTVTVAATNALGTGPVATLAGTVAPAEAPSAPESVLATARNGAVAVTWAPAAANGSSISLYRVTTSPGGRTCVTSGAGTGCTVTGLTNGQAYTVSVAATNAVGTGPSGAAPGTVVPRGVPSAPGSVAATRGSGSVAVTWSPAAANGSPVSLYRVTTSPGGKTCVTNGSGTGCRVTGLTAGQAYTVTVAASNAVGTGPVATLAGTVAPAEVPSAPQSVQATARNGSIAVTWAPAAANGSAISLYRATAGPSGRTCVTSGAGTGCTVTGLTNGQQYTVTVAATNAVGTGPASVPSAAVVPAP